MKVLEPGHKYLLDSYDGELEIILPFMKRIGAKYPFNEPPPHPGTNIQEVVRGLIDRLFYLQRQNPCVENQLSIEFLRDILYLMEKRAAINHGRPFTPYRRHMIEEWKTNPLDGHIHGSEYID